MLNALEEIIQRLNRIEEKLKQPGVLTGRWLTQQEVCNELHVSKRTLANYREKGILSFTRLGHKILYQGATMNLTSSRKPEKIDKQLPVSGNK